MDQHEIDREIQLFFQGHNVSEETMQYLREHPEMLQSPPMPYVPEHRLTGRTARSEPEMQRLPNYQEVLSPIHVDMIDALERLKEKHGVLVAGMDFGRLEATVLASMAHNSARMIIIDDEGEVTPEQMQALSTIYASTKDHDGRAELRSLFGLGPRRNTYPSIESWNAVNAIYAKGSPKPEATFTSDKPLTKRQKRRAKGKNHG